MGTRIRIIPLILISLLLPSFALTQSKNDTVFKQIFEKYKDVVVRLSNMQGMGSGFLTSEGFIITADHVVGTAVNVQMDYQGMHMFLRPCYRDHANDIAILYPLGYYDLKKKDYIQVPYDFLKGKSKITVDLPSIAQEEQIMLMGYPYGIIELKRILGSYKDEVYRYMENVPLYACDLPVIKGCSGGPVFNSKQEVIGIAVKYEIKPTDTEYLISYVSPAKNISQILKSIDKEYMKNISLVDKNIKGFDISSANLLKPKPKYIMQKNVKIIDEGDSKFVVNKNKAGYYFYSDPGLESVNLFFDFYMESVEKNKAVNESYVEVYIKWKDEENYVLMRMDMDQNKYYFVYMVEGKKEIKDAYLKMPVVSETKYNFELYSVGSSMGVYFDNIPVYYDNNLPFSEGACGVFFSEMKTIIFQDILIRIPKSL